MPVTSPSRPERLRLGLTWRVVTLTSLLLVALAVLFTYLSHTNLTRQFTATRQEQIERQQQAALPDGRQGVEEDQDADVLATPQETASRAIQIIR